MGLIYNERFILAFINTGSYILYGLLKKYSGISLCHPLSMSRRAKSARVKVNIILLRREFMKKTLFLVFRHPFHIWRKIFCFGKSAPDCLKKHVCRLNMQEGSYAAKTSSSKADVRRYM